MRGCWTGPGRGKEAECHMINFSESRVDVHREFCSTRCCMILLTRICSMHLLIMQVREIGL